VIRIQRLLCLICHHPASAGLPAFLLGPVHYTTTTVAPYVDATACIPQLFLLAEGRASAARAVAAKTPSPTIIFFLDQHTLPTEFWRRFPNLPSS